MFLEVIFACACERWISVSTGNSCFRVPRTVEEESALVKYIRPSSTKYKDKWAVEIFRELQRTRTLKFPDLEVGSVFKDYDFHLVCSVEDNLEHMDTLFFNYWLARSYPGGGNFTWYHMWSKEAFVGGEERIRIQSFEL